MSSDSTLRIWDTSNGNCLHILQNGAFQHFAVALSYDSARLACALVDNSLILREIKGNKDLQEFKGHSEPVFSIAFSYDSTRLASASYDRTVRIWNTTCGECIHTLEVGKCLNHISFDLTGSYLHTERGTIDMKFLSNPNVLPSTSEPQYHGLALSSDGEWITYNSKKLVWLPSEYRSSYSAVSGDTICVGVGCDIWMFTVDGPNAF